MLSDLEDAFDVEIPDYELQGVKHLARVGARDPEASAMMNVVPMDIPGHGALGALLDEGAGASWGIERRLFEANRKREASPMDLPRGAAARASGRPATGGRGGSTG